MYTRVHDVCDIVHNTYPTVCIVWHTIQRMQCLPYWYGSLRTTHLCIFVGKHLLGQRSNIIALLRSCLVLPRMCEGCGAQVPESFHSPRKPHEQPGEHPPKPLRVAAKCRLTTANQEASEIRSGVLSLLPCFALAMPCVVEAKTHAIRTLCQKLGGDRTPTTQSRFRIACRCYQAKKL